MNCKAREIRRLIEMKTSRGNLSLEEQSETAAGG
jgi:hypothetical protein